MTDLPIDIDYAKFLDWLVDRRRVARGWHSSLKAARVLLRAAADSMPADATIQAPTSYFTTVDALELISDKSRPAPFLSARETDVLGRYSHPTSRALSSARSSYESGHAYLAEAAQNLVRNTDIEAPALKVAISRLKDAIADFARREGPTVRAAAEAKEKFVAACAEYNIKADASVGDFECEIQRSVGVKAPALLRKAVASGKRPEVAEAFLYYRDFVSYASSDILSDPSSVQDCNQNGAQREDDALCPHLEKVIYLDEELLVSSPPSCAENCKTTNLNDDLGQMELPSEAIGTEVLGDTIDWGIEIDSGGTIEADNSHDLSKARNIEVPDNAKTTIDWDETIEIGGDDLSQFELQGLDHVTLTDDIFREAYMHDLLQIISFLKQRRTELLRGPNTQVALVLQQSSAVPDSIRSVDINHVQEMIEHIEHALDCINGNQARHILRLQAHSEEVARCARELTEKAHVAARSERNIGLLGSRKAQASEQLRDALKRFEILAKETKVLKRRTEENLRTIYGGREVNILGDINLVFSED